MEYIDNVSVLITFWDIVLQKGVVGVFLDIIRCSNVRVISFKDVGRKWCLWE